MVLRSPNRDEREAQVTNPVEHAIKRGLIGNLAAHDRPGGILLRKLQPAKPVRPSCVDHFGDLDLVMRRLIHVLSLSGRTIRPMQVECHQPKG